MEENILNLAAPGWIENTKGDHIFHWVHKPKNPSNLAVILVSPIGPEYMHCHRSIKYLAHSLQEQGITVIRYDNAGYGNSSGHLLEPGLYERWSETIGYLAQYLKELAGIEKIALVSLRSGALITDSFLENNTDIDHLVYWYPYSQGAAFNRDMNIIDELLHIQTDTQTEHINSGGYPLELQVQTKLKQRKLGGAKYQLNGDILIINPGASNLFLKKLESDGIKFSELSLSSLPKMAKQAELSEVPHDDIKKITNWLSERKSGVHDQKQLSSYGETSKEYRTKKFTESFLTSNSIPNIFGIFCQSHQNSQILNTPTVIITNGGAGHHIGPNRLHTDLARELASLGFNSVRFDLSNLGDSPLNHASSNNHPYPNHAVADIESIIQRVITKTGADRFIIAGLCSGAHNAFHAQLELKQYNIIDTILINPLTFYLKAGESIFEPDDAKISIGQSYYKEQARNWRVWLQLVTNPRKIFNVLTFVIHFVLNKANHIGKKIGQSCHVIPAEQLYQDIETITNNGKRLSFFISRNDPGYTVIMNDAGAIIKQKQKTNEVFVQFLSSVDHTFSDLESRRELITAICSRLETRYIDNKE